MCKVFSNEVAQNYSWIGFKGKDKFSLLRIAAVIISEYISFYEKYNIHINNLILININFSYSGSAKNT